MTKSEQRKRVIIVGAGFAGLAAARKLGDSKQVDVWVVDRRNHHLFQPLLYQVAMAGLSPAEIARPIRGLLSSYRNIQVMQGEVTAIDTEARTVSGEFGSLPYDYLLLATGAQHAYFGHEEWEQHAPGLKTLEQATEIRRRVLTAYERVERTNDPQERKRQLTFVVVGGGPTGADRQDNNPPSPARPWVKSTRSQICEPVDAAPQRHLSAKLDPVAQADRQRGARGLRRTDGLSPR